jgi:hypothetical protein
LLLKNEDEIKLKEMLTNFVSEVKLEELDEFKKEEFLYCINYIKTINNKDLERGSVTKAIALCSKHSYIFSFKKIQIYLLDNLIEIEDINEINKKLSDFFNKINSIEIKYNEFSYSSEYEKKIIKNLYNSTPEKLYYQIKFNFEEKDFFIELPLYLDDDEISDDKVSIKKLIQKFKEKIILIYNYILNGKRVLFIGYNQKASDVCYYVLSTYLLVKPLKNLIKNRIYPYSSINSLSSDFTK